MKRNNKVLLTVVLSASVISSFACLFAFKNNNYSVNALEFASDYFIKEDVNVSTNKTIPLSTGIKDYRNGILLSSNKSGSKITLKDNMSGTFSIDMLPYSANTFSSNDYETSSYANSYQDINTMSIIFTDTSNTDNSFKLVLNGGAIGNNVTVNAHVEANNEKMGIHYYQDSPALGNTKLANEKDIYTFLYGTSFSNMAVANASYSSSNVKSCKVEFDPSTMCVYGYSYGYRTDKVNKVLIWNFSKTGNDGSYNHQVLNGFENYNVSLCFDSINKSKTANVMVYEINNQKFSNTVLNNNIGPTSFAKLNDGSVNEKYYFAKPTAYDVLDGPIDFTGKIELYDSNNKKVEIYDGNNVITNDTFASNCYFIPSSKGSYSVVYTAYDTKDVAGLSQKYTINIKDKNDVTFNNSLEKVNYAKVNSTFNLNQVIATSNNISYSCKVEVIDPLFNKVNVSNNSILLENEGLYTINYKATVNDQEYVDTVKVYASNETKTLFNKNNSLSIDYVDKSLNDSTSGLKVSANLENASVTYAKELNINDLTYDNKLISLLALPTSYNNASFTSFTVKIIDALDESNYVQVLASNSSKFDVSYVRAGASNQKLAGLCSDGSIATSSNSGSEVLHSFTGKARYKELGLQTFDVYFDYDSKKIYTTDHTLVADLDDSSYFSNAFEGFKSDKFYLQVSCSSLNSATASYLIKEAMGYDLTSPYYIDNVSPTVTFDESDFSNGVINVAYPLPTITLNDNYSKSIDSQVKVYKNDKEVEIVNNSFIPTSIGQYVIKYIFTDGFGNVNEFSKRIQVVSTINPLEIELENDVLAGYVGTDILVSDYYVSGGTGKKIVEIIAKGKNTNTTYEVKNNTFKPLVADEYILTYTVKDRLNNTATATASVSVIVSDSPIIDTPSFIPKVLIDQNEVTFEQVNAMDYNNKTNPSVDVELYLEIEGKEVKLDSLTYLCQTTNMNSTATLTYKATSKITNKSSLLVYEIPVIRLVDNYDAMHLEQYLITNNFDSVTSEDTYIDLTTTRDNASFDFIKSVYAHGFNLSFTIPANANNVNYVTIYLTDVNDMSKQVKLDVIKGNMSDTFSYLRINDTTNINMAGTFYGTTAARLRVSYDNSLYSIKDDSGVSIANIKTYLNGNIFKGFSSEVNFKVVLNGVTGITTFRLFEIGNQIMSSVDGDYTTPSITLDGEIIRQAKINEDVIIPNAQAFDILGFKTTLSIRVVDPDNQVVYESNDGIGTTLKLTKYGTYYVNYNASDENNNPTTYSRTISVLDDIAPIITLDSSFKNTYSLNETITLANMKVEDNISSSENISSGIILEGPDSSFMTLTSNKFVASLKGIYRIRYYAIDEAGNMSYIDYFVEVI